MDDDGDPSEHEHHHAAIFDRPEGTSVGELEIDRILTVPNAITTGRLLCVPLFIYLIFGRDNYAGAAFLLGALGATDWVDGYAARVLNQSSTFGKMYDPIVDRFMLVVAVVSIFIAVDDTGFRVYAGIVGVREVLVSSWVLIITAMGAKRMDVTWWGKVGTFLNMVAFPCFLGAFEPSWSEGTRDVLLVVAWVAAVPGLVFNLAAAWQYIGLGQTALAEGRAESG